MSTKRAIYPVEFKALNDSTGQVEALVSIFNNVDLQGDRVMPGAFKKSIAAWKASGDPVPVVFSHDWGDMWSHIGVVNTLDETAKGLRAVYTLDINDNPAAAQTFKLLKRRSLKEHSFAFDVRDERRAKDGANELLDLDLIEIGPTLRGANPDTELIAVKSLVEDGPAKDQLDKAAAAKDADALSVLGTSSNTLNTLGTAVVNNVVAKAGRRLSQATQAELQAIHDDLTTLQSRMSVLMGTATDEPKSVGPEPDPEDEGAPDGDSNLDQVEADNEESETESPKAKSSDPAVAALLTRISEMRATTGIPA